MGIESKQPVVVPNLNLREITWALSYCRAARESGLDVVKRPKKDQHNRLFMGDIIPSWLLIDSQFATYLLAAVEGISVEAANIQQTDLTLLASKAELTKVQAYFGDTDADKLLVAGFPIDIVRLERFRVPWEQKIPRSVCFLGETRQIKNPGLELEIVRLLKLKNYSSYHLSPSAVSVAEDLKSGGCTVIEGIRGNRYYQTASQFQFVVNTSTSESLFISGIEAAVMGAIPIVPQQPNSGFNDWCPRALMYEYPSAEAAVNLICQVDRAVAPLVDYHWYGQQQYFRRVVERTQK